MKAGWLVVLLARSAAASGLQASDLQGLQLEWDPAEQTVEVDGVSINYQRAAGRDVAQLVARVQRRWLDAGTVLRALENNGWQLLTRWRGARSEVLQWRGAGATAELLLSSFDTSRLPAGPPAPPALLPAICTWGRQVDGAAAAQRYRQASARCRGRMDAVLASLRSDLPGSGWKLLGGSAATLHVTRAGSNATLILTSGRDVTETWLVWLSTQAAPGIQR